MVSPELAPVLTRREWSTSNEPEATGMIGEHAGEALFHAPHRRKRPGRLASVFCLSLLLTASLASAQVTIELTATPPSAQTMYEWDNSLLEVAATFSGFTAADIGLVAHDLPAFATGWHDQVTRCTAGTSGCTLASSVFFQPRTGDGGVYNFSFVASCNAAPGFSRRISYTLTVLDPGCMEDAPLIRLEPNYTQGTSNTICYLPMCGRFDQQVCYFDVLDRNTILGCRPTRDAKVAANDTCVSYGGLLDGHRYGYFVRAYDPQDPRQYVESATVYSTQDASAPPTITAAEAWPEAAGWVYVRWNAVVDAVSYTDHYVIYRYEESGNASLAIRVGTVQADSTDDGTESYTYEDQAGSPTGLEEGRPYRFCVTAVDAVGNESDRQYWFGPVVPDATPPCPPRPDRLCDAEMDGVCFVGGTTLAVTGNNPCIGTRRLQVADSVLVQAARDHGQYFDEVSALGRDFFTSSWVVCDPDSFRHSFDFLADDVSYVSNHNYLVRVKAKDKVGNESAWSEILTFRMDAQPPQEVTNLAVRVSWDEGLEQCVAQLTWQPNGDIVGESGLAEQHVYRSMGGGDFTPIATLSAEAATYADAFDILPSRTEVCYLIGGADRVGNVLVPDPELKRCDLTPAVPVLVAECAVEREGLCVVPADHVRVCWPDYDLTRVARIEIVCDEVTYVHDDIGNPCHEVPLPTPGAHNIRARAWYVSNTGSPWSLPVSVYRDASPPTPVSGLAIDDTSGVDFRLSWDPAQDDVAVDRYEVRMRRLPEDPWQCVGSVAGLADTVMFDGKHAEPGACADYDSLETYARYQFEVVPVDLVENRRTDGNDSQIACCNRAPRNLRYETTPGLIVWRWERSTPRIPIDNWRWLGEVWKDGVRVDSGTILRTEGAKYEFYPDALGLGDGDYVFRVREMPVGVVEACTTAWSQGCVCPYGVALPAVADFSVQPQPLLSEGDGGAGMMSLHWTYPTVRPGLERFHVTCASDGRTWDVPYGDPESVYELCVPDLASVQDHEFRILVHSTDYHDPSPEAVAIGRIDPAWAYTPQVCGFAPPAYTPEGGDGLTSWFNTDRVEVLWRWIGPDGAPVTGTAGAASCQIEAAITSEFEPTPGDLVGTEWLDASAAPAEVDLSELGGRENLRSGATVWWRVRARDRWWRPDAECGHESPWSTAYAELGVARAILDKTPPSPVDTLWFTTEAFAGPQSDVVDVRVHWHAVGDLPAENGSGVDHYVVYRSVPSPITWSVVGVSQDTFFVDAAVDMADLPGGLLYSVRAVDHVGNECVYENAVVNYQPAPAPTGLMATSKRHLEWSYPEDPDWFYVECADEEAELGTSWMRFNPEEAQACVPGTERSFTFATDQDFAGPNHPAMYFHVKALWGEVCAQPENSSPWSLVVSYSDEGEDATGPERRGGAPAVSQLEQNQPNPFNPRTEISFGLAQDGHVSLQIYNVMGQLVRTLVNGPLAAGRYTCAWNGCDDRGGPLANGIYFYRLRAPGFVETRKMTLMR